MRFRRFFLRSEFFIDCVDFEYCLRARRNGFYVLMTSEPVMEHEIGKSIEHRLLWKKVGTTNHAPIRQYFLARNSLVLVREYLCQEPRWILRYFWAWLKSIVPVLLFEKERISKMENIVCGFVDGHFWGQPIGDQTELPVRHQRGSR